MVRLLRFIAAALAFAAVSAHADYTYHGMQVYYVGFVANDTTVPDVRIVFYGAGAPPLGTVAPASSYTTGYPNTDPLCGPGTPTWAFLSTTDAGYPQILTEMRRNGAYIEFTVVPVTMATGTYCKISYVRSYTQGQF